MHTLTHDDPRPAAPLGDTPLPPPLLAQLRRDIDEQVDLRVQQHLAAIHSPRRAALVLSAPASPRLVVALLSLVILFGFLILDMLYAYSATTGIVEWLAAAGALVLLANLAAFALRPRRS
jgi:hypothetical protein